MVRELVLAALCCSSISFTITTTSIFKWLRESVSRFHPKLEELVHCPWCLNHYVIVVFLWTSDIRVDLTQSGLYNFLVTLFVIAGLSGLIHYVLLRAYEPVARSMAQREINKLKE